MYSQNNEEVVILSALSHLSTGKFVEIGSFDPFTFSNTRRLVELGWSGVYVEPSRPCFKKFVTEYDGNDKIVLVDKAIAAQAGKLKFYECDDAISTSDEAFKIRWEQGWKVTYTEVEVDAITGKDLFEAYGDNVDFLNIDTENTNIEVLNSIPTEYIKRCHAVCIEHQNELSYVRQYFNNLGFIEILYNGENLIFKNTNV